MPSYARGQQYLRMKETGAVYPMHPEQLKLVRKDLMDIVIWDGNDWVKQETPPELKPTAPKANPEIPPVVAVVRDFEPPSQPEAPPPVTAPAAPSALPRMAVQPVAPRVTLSVPTQPPE